MRKTRILTYAQAINEGISQSMDKDPSVFIIGEGVPDPKGIFGTTLGLRKKFGKERVMDMPLSENAVLGIAIGAALRGFRPILTHQRVDFSLLSFDQLINNAAKWYFMFGGNQTLPLFIRMIIGRGWGQGPQHSQSLQALFAHIPGLKVIMPATAYDAKGLTIAAVKDNNPVVSLEHRWLFNLTSEVPIAEYTVPIGQARVLLSGTDVTIAATSYAVIEALDVAKALARYGISVEVIDIRSLKPLDTSTIIASVAKTRRLVIVDTGHLEYGITAEISSRITEALFTKLKHAPLRIGLPDIPTPTAPQLTHDFYPNKNTMARIICKLVGKPKLDKAVFFPELETKPRDVPDASFTGPF